MFISEALLGFSPIEVLLHILNLFILLAVIRLLLYKHIKKFMKEREEKYRAADNAAKTALADADAAKTTARGIIDEARQQAVRITEEAQASAMIQHDEIMSHAKTEAKNMVEKADEDIEAKRVKSKEELAHSVSELAIDIAAQILEREVKAKDNDAIIESMINSWKEQS